MLEQAATFYQHQLDQYPQALGYLWQRGVYHPALIRELGIGYAPGGNLRRHLTAQGYSFELLRTAGLINAQGADALYQRIVFPLRQGEHIVNLYGRSIGSAFAHRFLPGCKGGLYAWEKVRHYGEVILVEGLFDYGSLRQAGFQNATCSLGTHLNDAQFQQLCDGQRTVYLTFDVERRPERTAGCRATGPPPWRTRHHGPSRPAATGLRSQLVLRWGWWERGRVPVSAGGCPAMKFRVIRQPAPSGAHSPIRVIEQNTGREVAWINQYLNREHVRRLADKSLYSYAHSLLHFVRWWESVHHTGDISQQDLTDSTLLDYLRFQSSRQPPPSATTINDRVACADRAIRNQFPDAPCQVAHGFHKIYLHRRPMGLGRPRFELSRLRIKEPRLNIVPLSVDEVARFWSSFRNARDLAIVGLMLMHGLRSVEVMALNRDDVLLSEGQLRVRGKGNKLRLLPLAPGRDLVQRLRFFRSLDPLPADGRLLARPGSKVALLVPLRDYLHQVCHSLGLSTHIVPHQFRHIYATEMLRSGVSFPVLMKLLGHVDPGMTMRYVDVALTDLEREFQLARVQA